MVNGVVAGKYGIGGKKGERIVMGGECRGKGKGKSVVGDTVGNGCVIGAMYVCDCWIAAMVMFDGNGGLYGIPVAGQWYPALLLLVSTIE